MDLRTPIGYLFIVNGLILGAWGIFGTPAATDAATAWRAGSALNLGWGVAMLVFGAAMLAGARYAAKCDAHAAKSADDKKSCGTGCGCAK